MKSITFAAAAAFALLQLASAQPHRRRHAHHVHQHQNVKKDGDVVVTIVDTVYAEATEVPEVVVYVNQDGAPVSTVTNMVPVPNASVWSTAHHSESPSSTSAAPAPTTTTTTSSSNSRSTTAEAAPSVAPVVQNIQAPESSTPAAATPVATTESPAATYAAPASTSSAASASSSSTSSGSSGFGVVYSPYNSDGTCKSQTQVTKDFENVNGYSRVRIYGTDCNQVSTVLTAAKAKGMKLFAGVFDLAALNTEIQTIISAANGDWSSFETISIGNELVNSGTASADAVVAAIKTARGLLSAAGYTGKVVTVDTLVAARNNPSLCDASDFCAVNCHPFFDGGVTASESGNFLTTMIPTLQSKLQNPSQKIVITETGWPWQGETNGKAVPSLENQSSALGSIKSAFTSNPGSIILFTAFNDMWKKNTAAQFGAEQYWGMGGNNSPSG